jgi:hypothetical protein
MNNIKEMKSRNKQFYVILEEMIIDEKDVDIIINIHNKQIEAKQLELFRMRTNGT